MSTHFWLKSSVATPVQAVPGETVETDAGAVSAICGVAAMDSTHYCGVRADGVRNESLQRSQTPYCDQRRRARLRLLSKPFTSWSLARTSLQRWTLLTASRPGAQFRL